MLKIIKSINKEGKMSNFRKTVKRFVPIAFMILVMFLLIHYWDDLVGLGRLCLKAGMSLFVGVGIAYVVNILMKAYENLYTKITKKTGKLRRVICLILAYISIVAIITVVIVVVGPQFVKSLITVMTTAISRIDAMLATLSEDESFGIYAQKVLDMMPQAKDMTGIIEKVGGFLLNGASGTFSSLVTSLSSLFNGLTSILIGVVFSIYILLDKEHLKKQFSELLRVYVYRGGKILKFLGILNVNLHNYIVAQVTDAVILGTLTGVGMWIIRLPYPALSGVIVAVTALIPVVGALLGATISAFIIFTVSPVKALIFVIYIVLLQQVDNNFIYPKVVGENVNLPSIWVLAAITIGGSLFGVMGMLCAVPIAATAYQVIKEDYKKRIAEEKNGASEADETGEELNLVKEVETLLEQEGSPQEGDSGSDDSSIVENVDDSSAKQKRKRFKKK